MDFQNRRSEHIHGLPRFVRRCQSTHVRKEDTVGVLVPNHRIRGGVRLPVDRSVLRTDRHGAACQTRSAGQQAVYFFHLLRTARDCIQKNRLRQADGPDMRRHVDRFRIDRRQTMVQEVYFVKSRLTDSIPQFQGVADMIQFALFSRSHGYFLVKKRGRCVPSSLQVSLAFQAFQLFCHRVIR
jgi:hypothetical protein